MKQEFWFPTFDQLQLGPPRSVDPRGLGRYCGCLVHVRQKIVSTMSLDPGERYAFHEILIDSLRDYYDLIDWDAKNNHSNRRKCYNALVHAVEEFGYEIEAE